MTKLHRPEQLAALGDGLARWFDFADACLARTGPASVVCRGTTPHARQIRMDAEQWREQWGSNPGDLVHILALVRLEVASAHGRTAAHLLQHDEAGPALHAIARSLAEVSARAMWLLDVRLTARQAVARAFTELLEEVRRLGASPADATRTALSKDEVIQRAEAAGFEAYRNRKGKVLGFGQVRPTTLNLLEGLDDDSQTIVSFGPAVRTLHTSSSAAVHGSMLAWMEMITADRIASPQLRAGAMNVLAAHLMCGLHLHMRAVDAWNARIAWEPEDLFKAARLSSLAAYHLAHLNILRGTGRASGGEELGRPGFE